MVRRGEIEVYAGDVDGNWTFEGIVLVDKVVVSVVRDRPKKRQRHRNRKSETVPTTAIKVNEIS